MGNLPSFDRNGAIEHFFAKNILYLNQFLDAYWMKVTKEIFIPKLINIYDQLVEYRITEDNQISWGDADGYLYYIPNKSRKVIVFTTQNRNYLFILLPEKVMDYFPNNPEGSQFGPEYDSYKLHIRRTWKPYKKECSYSIPQIKGSIKKMLDSVEELEEFADDFSEYPQRPSLEVYHEVDFNIDTYKQSDKVSFCADYRDPGYILSFDPIYGGRLHGTKYSHNELELLLTCNLECMTRSVEELNADL